VSDSSPSAKVTRRRWTALPEADALVARLCAVTPKLRGVDPKAIGCFALCDEGGPRADEAGEELWATTAYVIEFYRATWDRLTEPQRKAMLMQKLLALAESSAAERPH
jgi:hypothetical protein